MLLVVNVLLYIFIFIYASKWETAVWFDQHYFQPYGRYLACFAVISAITCLLFLEMESKEKVNGPLLTSGFLVLNLGLLFSSDILRVSLLLIFFEILELLVLSNTKDFRKSMLRDLALTKLFSIIALSIAIVFIIISKDSVSVLEFNIKNYDLYYLGVCFFVIYVLSVMYITPLEEVRKKSLFNSSNFSTLCSVLSKFVILGTVLISILKTFIDNMEPHVQEEILLGLKIVMFFSIISLILTAMSKENKDKVAYYLFCLNNILTLLTVYGVGEIDIRPIFFLLLLSSLGLFAGIYVEKNSSILIGERSKGLLLIFYLLGIITLWGIPTTIIFKIKYLLIEQIFSFDTTVLLITFMLISGFLWYPVIASFNRKFKNQPVKKQQGQLEY